MKKMITVVLATIVISLPGCGGDTSSDASPNAKLVAEIAALEKKYNEAQSRYHQANSDWRSANARSEYDSIVRQGDAGTSEMLILAQRQLSNPAYSEEQNRLKNHYRDSMERERIVVDEVKHQLDNKRAQLAEITQPTTTP